MITSAQIDAAIAANEAAVVDDVLRGILDSLSDQLRRYRCTISKLMPDEVAVYCGDNWRGPCIEQLIRDSQFHRTNGAAKASLERLGAMLDRYENETMPRIFGDAA